MTTRPLIATIAKWAGQALHFCVLAGLALMLKWDRLGAALTVVSTTAFFLWTSYRRALTLPLINLIPIAFFTVYWLARRS